MDNLKLPLEAKVPHALGLYKRSGYRFTKKDGQTFILAKRSKVKKGQSLFYLMSEPPSGTSFYWSGLFPIKGSENLYRAEYRHTWYSVLFSEEGMTIALSGAQNELPGLMEDAPANKVPLNINRNFVTHRVTKGDLPL